MVNFQILEPLKSCLMNFPKFQRQFLERFTLINVNIWRIMDMFGDVSEICLRKSHS